VSAFAGDYAPVAGTLLGRLQQAYGIRLDRLGCALDLRNSPLQCWVMQLCRLTKTTSVVGKKC
ncbi:MAG: hypothetical protein ACKO26_07695, partial [Planctomycetota bacterium]